MPPNKANLVPIGPAPPPVPMTPPPLATFTLNEQVVFVHRPSKSFITADLYWNYPREGVPFGTRAWKFGMDKV